MTIKKRNEFFKNVLQYSQFRLDDKVSHDRPTVMNPSVFLIGGKNYDSNPAIAHLEENLHLSMLRRPNELPSKFKNDTFVETDEFEKLLTSQIKELLTKHDPESYILVSTCSSVTSETLNRFGKHNLPEDDVSYVLVLIEVDKAEGIVREENYSMDVALKGVKLVYSGKLMNQDNKKMIVEGW